MNTASGDGGSSTPSADLFQNPPLSPGQRFGDWTLLQPLGAGGMGTVWLAHRAEEYGALKVGFHQEPSSVSRFFRERSLLWRLRSPRVVRLLDWGDAPVPWYVMERVTGDSLERRLEGGPLDPSEVRRVLEDLAGAVTDMHRLRLAHRDLKPANIMVAPGLVKVIDLGLGHEENDHRLTQEGFCSGSLGYLPPEALDGVFEPMRVDLYALGILLAEMLVGRWIFGSAKALARWQYSGSPLRLSGGPPWMLDLARDLTHPQVSRRISRVEEVNERLLWADCRRVNARGCCLVGPAEAQRVLDFLEAA